MPSTTIIDGKAFAERLRGKIAVEMQNINSKHGWTAGLAVVLVGEDPASQVYVRSKGKQSVEAGFQSFEHRLPVDTGQKELLALIDALNRDAKVHGILVQLPLPDHIDSEKVLCAIDPNKDVDGFHPINVGRLWSGADTLVPCTPLGCSMLLDDHFQGNLSGLNAVIVGRSNIVGKPCAALLLQRHCTVTISHSRSRNLEELCRSADILIAAVGRAEMIGASSIGEGACVIDVGINRIERDGRKKLVGDVDFAAAQGIAGGITPVPGGVGPMTIACLLHNTLIAACRQHSITPPTFR